MTLKIYGVARSRAFRVLWLAEELELPYEHIPVELRSAAQDPRLLAVNPNGKLPAIDDEGFTLFESLAINLYLAKKHGGPLAPKDLQEDARMTAWSLWAMSECEASTFVLLANAVLLPPAERKPVENAKALGRLKKPLAVIDKALATDRHLVGGRFTVADLNVASILGWLAPARVDLEPWPNLASWLAACQRRPAARKAGALRG